MSSFDLIFVGFINGICVIEIQIQGNIIGAVTWQQYNVCKRNSHQFCVINQFVNTVMAGNRTPEVRDIT
jgi:hypothetical protein